MARPIRMTRRVGFSSGHRYWISTLNTEENRELFGQWASPFNHGHNYVLEVTVEGEVDPSDGMIVNIKRVDDVLKARIVSQFDQRSINDEIPWFHSRSASLENLMRYIRDALLSGGKDPVFEVSRFIGRGADATVRLVGLRLEETPLLYGELEIEGERMTLTRVYEFAAAHRLHSPTLSSDENTALFGKCSNAAGHGHNYVLEVTVEGKPDERTGMLVDIVALDRTVEDLVVDRYDHKNLNEDIPEFKERVTTSEVVAQTIFDRLKGNLPAELARVRLFETARNVFEVSAR
jgi:6-pyruvoyltetrahydropterin/6-carboxytetrahydropterin synthase